MSDKYLKLLEQITALGYNSPQTDPGDARYREIWKYIEDNNLDLKLEDAKNVVSKLAPQTDKYYQNLQCRSDCELEEDVDQMVKSFFEDGEKLIRLPIAIMIDEKYYIAVGNHRSRAMKKGYEKYKDYNFSGHILVIDPNNEIHSEEKLRHGFEIATKSNKQTNDQTRPETASDIAHQLEIAFLLFKKEQGNKTYTIEERAKWAEGWLDKNKPDTSPNTCTRAKNKFASEEHGQSIAFPEDEELSREWKKYWPDSDFVERADTHFIQEKQAAHPGNFHKKQMTAFLNRKETPDERPRMEVCVRTGNTLDKIIESKETIASSRKAYLKHLRDWNRNSNAEHGRFPIVRKIMFVKQINNGSYQAWEWKSDIKDKEDKEKGTFVEKKVEVVIST